MNELQNLVQIFQNKLFRIPDYQRGYAWQEPQLIDFWEDLVNLRSDRNHYTGLLSLKMLEKSDLNRIDDEDQWLLKNSYKAYHIVDGQQRLTTFMILLNEIVNLVMSLPENANQSEENVYLGFESLKDIRAKFICKKRPPEGFVTTYIFGYENDNPSADYLRYKIFGEKYGGTLKETYYTKNLKHSKEFFYRMLQEYYQDNGIRGIEDLYEKLTAHMMFNIHEIADDYDVFVAFETMNNRGKRLTNLELLKNRLIYLTTLYSKETLDETDENALRVKINDAWKEVYYQLGRNERFPLSDDEFLKAHWIIYFSYSRKKGDDYIKYLLTRFSHKSIYEIVNNEIIDEADSEVSELVDDDSSDDVEQNESVIEPEESEFLHPRDIADYVNSLKEFAEYWYYSNFPSECNIIGEEEKLWIDRLNKIGIGYFRPLIAVAICKHEESSSAERIDFFKAIERFIFIDFRLGMAQSSYKSSDYYRKIRDYYNSLIQLPDITEDLEETTDQDAAGSVVSFVNKMSKRFDDQDGFYSWRDLRYFLYEYEYSIAEKYKIFKLDWAVLTNVVKDKITIEHIFPQTPTKLYWRNNFRQFNAHEKKLLAGTLGNLLPLSKSINSSLQNDGFNEKKTRGYMNGSHSEIEVSKEPYWDAEKIYERGMHLLEFMEKRWNFTFESEDQKKKLLHIEFVHDGRTVPPEITEEDLDDDIKDIDAGTTRFERRKAYWTYALPYIKDAFGINGPYSNVNPSANTTIDGFVGVGGVNLYCKISKKSQSIVTGIWINFKQKDRVKELFDLIYSNNELIEKSLDIPITWRRNDDGKASSIFIRQTGFDYTEKEQWVRCKDFHVKYIKLLYDLIIQTYVLDYVESLEDDIVINPAELNRSQGERLKFWTRFNEIVVERGKPFNLRKPGTNHWYDIGIGTVKAHIALTLVNKDGYVGVELFIGDNKQLFDALYEKKVEIEKALGLNLEWLRLNEKNASKIQYHIPGLNFDDHSNYDELMNEMIDKAILFSDVFKKYLD